MRASGFWPPERSWSRMPVRCHDQQAQAQAQAQDQEDRAQQARARAQGWAWAWARAQGQGQGQGEAPTLLLLLQSCSTSGVFLGRAQYQLHTLVVRVRVSGGQREG